MRARTINKSSARDFFSLQRLFFFMLLSLNCGSSEYSELEGQPLLNSGGERETIYITLDENIQEENFLRQSVPIMDLTYDSSLLVNANVDRAQKQMSVIVDFISLCKNKKFFQTLQQKYREAAAQENIFIDTPESLTNYLNEKSWQAIREEPTLAGYFKGLRTQSDNLIEFAKKLLHQRSLLLQYNESQGKIIETLRQAGVPTGESFETSNDIEALLTNSRQSYKLPLLSFALGVSVTAIGFLCYLPFVSEEAY
jgi:hypothetical protein